MNRGKYLPLSAATSSGAVAKESKKETQNSTKNLDNQLKGCSSNRKIQRLLRAIGKEGDLTKWDKAPSIEQSGVAS